MGYPISFLQSTDSSEVTFPVDESKLPTIKSFVTGSEFMPYVTTIGLYNSYGDLLAVGKLAVPSRLSSLVDTTFVIRLDIEV